MATIVSSNPVVLGTNTNDTITTRNSGSVGQIIYGDLGNDIYIIDTFYDIAVGTDTAEDQIVEAANGGIDTVNVKLGRDTGDVGGTSYALGANLEHLRIEAFGNTLITATGNQLNNEISLILQEPNNTFELYGLEGNDKLSGGINADILDGGSGVDTMIGGNGGDTYYVDSASDIIIETADGAGLDSVVTSVNYTLSNYVETLILAGVLNINGTGNNLDNGINGNNGNNKIAGLGGKDTLNGGGGNDTLSGGDGDDQISGLNDNDSIDGGSGNDSLSGDNGNDKITGGAGNDTLNGGNGNNTMEGGAGDDLFVSVLAGDTVTDTGGGIDLVVAFEQLIGDLGTGIENLQIQGTIISARGNGLNNYIFGNNNDNYIFGLGGNDYLDGQLGNDVLIGDAGNDTLDGSFGNDLLMGGLGNDTYLLDSSNDIVSEALNGGIDSVFSTASINVGTIENVENITLSGTANINAFGNALKNLITGNAGINYLDGDNGDDTLIGGAGVDSLIGGTGNDTYIVDESFEFINELGPSTDIDTVLTSVTFNLQAFGGRLEVENLTLTGTDAINGFGNDTKNNKIIGNSNNNTLNGLAGNDTMIGGLGNDTYNVDAIGDVVNELANQGRDLILTSLSTYSIASLPNIEELGYSGIGTFNGIGNGGNNRLSGGVLNDTLQGGAGNDTFFGGAGDDSMVGGLGDDLYFMEGNDIITEGLNAGNDVITDITTSLSLNGAFANIENALLALTAASGTNLTGNAARNTLSGSQNDNTLDGLAGNDTLAGGAGNDTLLGGANDDVLDGGIGNDRMEGGTGNDVYYLDVATDGVIENFNEGTDSIISGVSIDLLNFANVENLTVTGTANLISWGNSLNNTITGNDGDDDIRADPGNDKLFGGLGNDTLNGGTGIDTMVGGTGNDFYFVENTGDVVTELANSGIDTIQSSVTFNLTTKGANVENLTLSGADNTNATGNVLDNAIIGNSGSNLLKGEGGNDTLTGGNGTDTLTGGAGSDTFVFNNDGVENVTDYTYGIDFIELNIAGLTFTGAGNTLTANQFDLTTGSIDINTRIIYDQTSGNLFYDADGSGGGSTAVQIADFTNGLSLSSISFFSV